MNRTTPERRAPRARSTTISRRAASSLGLLTALALSASACAERPSPEPLAPPPAAAPPPEAPPDPVASSPAPSASNPDSAAAPVAPEIPEFIRAAVGATDRAEEDRALDAGRHPDQTLAFFGIAPGQRVAELGAGGGYTAELLARVVGDKGVVFAQNSRFILEKFAEKPWSERLKKPAMKNVIRVNREFEDPFPPEAKNLDAVLLILLYHDTVWWKVDREKMNRAVFAALRPGGVFAVVDHSARAGAGLADVETLHRIEESAVKTEIQRAGFVLDGEVSFLRAPNDTRDWSASPRTAGERRGTSDRFVLRFKKP